MGISRSDVCAFFVLLLAIQQGSAGERIVSVIDSERASSPRKEMGAMKSVKPPMAFIAPGTVYRRDDDATHSPMFHQIEAFPVR